MSDMAEKLKEYCTVISGYAFKSKDLSEGTDIPVIKIGNISNGKNVVMDDLTQYVNEEFLSVNEKYHIKNGDILISLTGSHMNQPNSMVGRCCRNLDDTIYLLNQRAGKIIPNKSVDKDFLYYVFRLPSIQYAIANRAYGGANQVNVSPKDVMGIKFDIPDITFQKKIANVLNAYDSLIQNNNKRIHLLEQMAENLYKEWFVRFRFPGYENVDFENGIPNGWAVEKVKKCVNRLPFNQLYKQNDLENEGSVIVIDQSSSDFLGFHNNEPSHYASIEKPIILFGDHSCKFVLMIRDFSLGENVVPFISFDENLLDNYYLYYAVHKLIATEEYKRKAMEEFWLQSNKTLKELRKIKYLELDAPVELIKDALLEEQANDRKAKFTLLIDDSGITHKAKSTLISWFEENIPMSFNEDSDVEAELEKYYSASIKTYKDTFLRCMRSYQDAASIDLGLIDNAYGNLDFIISNHSIREYAYNDIFDKMRKFVYQFREEAYYFNLLNDGKGNFAVCASKVVDLNKLFFATKDVEAHDYVNTLVYQTAFDEIESELEKFRCKIYKAKYVPIKASPISGTMRYFGEDSETKGTDG